MIIVTGGAGFIGSAIVWKLNKLGHNKIIIVDELGHTLKWRNLTGLKFHDFINKNDFLEEIKSGKDHKFEAVIHMGANSSTTETNADHLMQNNYQYTKTLAEYCLRKNIRFIYASSAATYGDGSAGFADNDSTAQNLTPLNMYGYSKQLFDLWALQTKAVNKIAGIKYFNVYGPNEYHKGDMRSVVHKAFEQIRDTGKVKLFKSLNSRYKDGEQMRDFIYVKDAVDMTLFFLDNKNVNGIFNVGSGKARTWKDLAAAIFKALNKEINIEYIDLPRHLADKYQYFTEAGMEKIKSAGYDKKVMSLESGVSDYVTNYLLKDPYFNHKN